MANFLKNKAKGLFIAYAIMFFVLILFSLYYSTSYADVHVYYKINATTKEVEFGRGISFTGFETDNDLIYTYFGGEAESDEMEGYATSGPFAEAIKANTKNSSLKLKDKKNFFYNGGYETTVYNFQQNVSAANSLLVVYGLVGLVCFALLCIFSNQSRKVYYKSNLYAGIIIPLGAIVFGVIVLVKNLTLLMTFSKNADLFKITSVLQNSKISEQVKRKLITADYSELLAYATKVNSTTFIVTIALLAIVICYSLFLMGYTIWRYKECSEKRAQIIERAVKNND